MQHFNFDMGRCIANVHMRNPKARIIPISALTGEGVDELAGWLLEEIAKWKNNTDNQ